MPSSDPKNKKYAKILNNLLDIKRMDPTTFTRVNSTSSFDIVTKFGKEYASSIIDKDSITLKLKEIDFEELIAAVKQADEQVEIVAAYQKYKERLPRTKQDLLKSPERFGSTKQDLIDKLEIKVQKMNTRWK